MSAAEPFTKAPSAPANIEARRNALQLAEGTWQGAGNPTYLRLGAQGPLHTLTPACVHTACQRQLLLVDIKPISRTRSLWLVGHVGHFLVAFPVTFFHREMPWHTSPRLPPDSSSPRRLGRDQALHRHGPLWHHHPQLPLWPLQGALYVWVGGRGGGKATSKDSFSMHERGHIGHCKHFFLGPALLVEVLDLLCWSSPSNPPLSHPLFLADGHGHGQARLMLCPTARVTRAHFDQRCPRPGALRIVLSGPPLCETARVERSAQPGGVRACTRHAVLGFARLQSVLIVDCR